ncbi:MAG: hypothetical protein K0S37_2384 [Microbacterium sp.]|jgi:hypothetical protein|nr:hypothetical protein [Microbacterium sp.]
MSDGQSWAPTPESRAKVQRVLDAIDLAQSSKPMCGLTGCGQRANRLDEFGLCSKVSDSHKRVRLADAAYSRAGRR